MTDTILQFAALIGLFVITGGVILWTRINRTKDDWPPGWPEDEVTYSMEEVMARMEKSMRIAKKYYSRNQRRGGMFRFDHPISKRRGQKFLGELSPGLPDMINKKIARQKPGRVVEQEPVRGSRYRSSRRHRRYFGNNR